MNNSEAAVAVFADHGSAEAAIKKLTEAGFAMTSLSVVGKGYHSEEQVVGFYNAGDRIKFWAGAERSGVACGGCFSAACFCSSPLSAASWCSDIWRRSQSRSSRALSSLAG